MRAIDAGHDQFAKMACVPHTFRDDDGVTESGHEALENRPVHGRMLIDLTPNAAGRDQR